MIASIIPCATGSDIRRDTSIKYHVSCNESETYARKSEDVD
jgi:hypothetical protein